MHSQGSRTANAELACLWTLHISSERIQTLLQGCPWPEAKFSGVLCLMCESNSSSNGIVGRSRILVDLFFSSFFFLNLRLTSDGKQALTIKGLYCSCLHLPLIHHPGRAPWSVAAHQCLWPPHPLPWISLYGGPSHCRWVLQSHLARQDTGILELQRDTVNNIIFFSFFKKFCALFTMILV